MQTQVPPDKTITNPLSSLTRFLQDVKIIAQPYWYPTELNGRAFSDVICSWGMLALMVLSIILLVSVDAFASFWNRYVLDIVIEQRDLSKYLETLWLSSFLIVLITCLVALAQFVRKKVALDWYKWLSNNTLKQYLSDRAYYKIGFTSGLENPDQRLSQEIEPITTITLRFLTTLLEKSLQMITFLVILWTISQEITIYLVIYTISGNFIAVYLTQELNKINRAELNSKAEYNYALTHVRDHAESIAFFRGEEQEEKIIERRFNNIIKNAEQRINWERFQDLFNRGYQSAISVFSMFILTPMFIQDKIDFGEISQASLCCFLFSNALGQLVSEWGTSAKLSNYIERLASFSDGLKTVSLEPKNLGRITTVEDNRLAFENFTLQTPDYEKVIVENLSLSVPSGKGLLIVGPSGRGKSSLLRAIAGLWNAGTGRLVRPDLEEMLFLPQRPYIILGTLRDQLLYPHTTDQITDQELEKILEKVNLQHLLTQTNVFDKQVNWENILSLGEQQRLAFARMLVTRPSFAILDEATSALDLINEESLYQQLQQTQTTFISVGHRESLFNYHQWVLELAENSRWQFLSVEDYQQQKFAAINFLKKY
ncbi:ABC transporter ATP-binding protein/permease [Planktothrix agardhii]|jgi:putative ATP-binding cassette transporter/heme-transporting ATPase|uniref:ABC transporter ATP-binding protein/permease n=1 Tax=Planktothrix agardhii TaxID=1160 RepID=UPI001D0A0835|nr:ATP-binding cassette domain-containing protein [Planktothrix agardhii]MCB8758567.1 ATP-binding cassette domain-containing protein [Planktothrix agardhii 1813]MCB8765693.1 ATP-binding cassette domain-containing protein [Planktothrix agardhii 1809]MCB8779325.1 ATP-binding cassette domain-containing protein [Planktothrix agardhii 1031]MCB8783745.1 ATP-binding cassette domain-containing protein [Planktothrix agardhii 1808]MCB8787737.1 ATP-binding cassette domain-containing protein [Planktothrix